MKRVDITAVLCVFLPLVMGAPVEDSLKQQLSSGLLRGGSDELPYWSQEMYPDDALQHSAQFSIRTRGMGGLDSLGRGNILRSLDMGNDWGDLKGSNWRFGNSGTPKRGGGLDSLGRGNILRRVNYDDEISNLIHALNSASRNNPLLRSLDSLGKGNILKRSIRSTQH